MRHFSVQFILTLKFHKSAEHNLFTPTCSIRVRFRRQATSCLARSKSSPTEPIDLKKKQPPRRKVGFKRESTDAPVTRSRANDCSETHHVTSGMSKTLAPADPCLIVVQTAQIIVLLVANVVQRSAWRLNALPPRRHFVIRISSRLAERSLRTTIGHISRRYLRKYTWTISVMLGNGSCPCYGSSLVARTSATRRSADFRGPRFEQQEPLCSLEYVRTKKMYLFYANAIRMSLSMRAFTWCLEYCEISKFKVRSCTVGNRLDRTRSNQTVLPP